MVNIKWTARKTAANPKKISPIIHPNGQAITNPQIKNPKPIIALIAIRAKRAKINSIILPADNKKNVDEIDKKYLKGLNFFYVENILEVVEYALLRKKVSNFKKL